MIIGGRRASLLLFLGDFAAFALSLYLTILLRYGAVPDAARLAPFVLPFSLLFALWLIVFYGAGLYGKRLALFPSRLPDALLGTQITNIVIAALFFFLVPAFGLAPKTILVLYLFVSLVLIFIWRLALYPRLTSTPRRERAALIADTEEARALVAEVNGNPRYGIEIRETVAPQTDASSLLPRLTGSKVALLIVDTNDTRYAALLPQIYHLTYTTHQFQFVSFADLYEEIFDRIPLSQLSHAWFLENVSPHGGFSYALVKRAIDLIGGILMLMLTIVLTPFIWIANYIEGPGPTFITQQRFGKDGTRIRVYKFRSMHKNDAASGNWMQEGENRVTRVGAFLRRTSLDEFPQAVNVIAGELSLIGPRNDILGLGTRLREALPYYDARYLVKPGITGWAQINQQYEQKNISPQSIEETKTRLAYDFYYLKHRSLGLDLVIALKTIKRMLFRVSSW